MRAFLLLFFTLGAFAQTDAIRSLEGALADATDPGAIMMQLAGHHAGQGNVEAGLKWLAKAVDLRQGFRPAAPPFAPLREHPGYAALARRIAKDNPPIERGRIVSTAPLREIITEGLAADPGSGSLFVGSMNRHSIYRVARDGKWSEFVRSGQDGLGQPLGMAVAHNSLYVCNDSDTERSVLQFALESGRLLHRWTLPGGVEGHFLNDLAVAADGGVYVTDSRAGQIYYGAKGAAELGTLDLGRRFLGANGIALAPEGRMYVACFPDGIVLIDLERKAVRPLDRPASLTLAAIDGLYYHGDRLIGIQNYTVIDRVVSWKLNASGDAVLSEDILARGGKRLEDPTTGAFLGGKFYFIANSGIPYWKEGKVTKPDALRPTAIIELPIAAR
ncbi:MAG TPA: hypothetical protein VN428_03575 [Bryobacteraceae bacterium]|nr:hypothetical protein [Bryobacteraceae bacterium]